MDLAERQGSLLRGTYRLDRVLGSGGMGVVFAATHERLGNEVAVKLLQPELAREERVLTRFFDEARAAAQLRHPNVIRVFDVDEEDGTPFLVMERLHGESLGDRLAREGRLAPDDALAIIEPVLDALEASHAAGIVHRDIKPDNIFLAEEAGAVVPKLLDFGIAKLRGGESVTATGVAIGTPAYMAPEQAAGRPGQVGAWTDVWSIAVVLFECLAGRMHYTVDTEAGAMAWLTRLATEPPRSLALTAPDVPPQLAAAVDAALALDPDERTRSAHALRVSLRGDDALASAPTLSAPSVPPPPRRPTPATRDASRRKPRLWLGVGLVGAAVLAAAGWFATRPPEPGPPEPSAPAPVAPAVVSSPVPETPVEAAAAPEEPPAPAPEPEPDTEATEIAEPARAPRRRRRPTPTPTPVPASAQGTPSTRTGTWSADQL